MQTVQVLAHAKGEFRFLIAFVLAGFVARAVAVRAPHPPCVCALCCCVCDQLRVMCTLCNDMPSS